MTQTGVVPIKKLKQSGSSGFFYAEEEFGP